MSKCQWIARDIYDNIDFGYCELPLLSERKVLLSLSLKCRIFTLKYVSLEMVSSEKLHHLLNICLGLLCLDVQNSRACVLENTSHVVVACLVPCRC